MTLKLIEGAVDAVKTYLSDNIAAKLDALDTEYADGITLDDIKAWYVAEVQAVPEFPSVFILGESMPVDGEGNGWMKSQSKLTIAVMATDQNPETLKRRLYRYIRALIELLIEARVSVSWAYVIEFTNVNYSPLFSAAGEFLSDARLEVSLRSYETK